MSLEYIVHRPGSPANRLVDQKIAEVMTDPLAQICVITPARSTFQAQQRLVKASNRGGHLGLQVISPARLAHEVVSGSYGAALETLPEFEKTALIHRAVRKNKDKLPAFGQYDTMDFAALVGDMLDRLHAQGVCAEDVRKYADESGSAHAADLALVWEEYEKERDGRMDDWMRMETAIEHLEQSRLFADIALVVVHGFDAYDEQEKRLIRAVLDAAPRVLLSVYGSDDPADADLFADTEQAGHEFVQYAKRQGIEVQQMKAGADSTVPGEIEHAARYVFAPYTAPDWNKPVSAIRVLRAASKEEEVRAVAEEIARLHLEENVPFEQFAVVYGEDAEYADIVERVFTEANVPHFASRLVDPASTSVGAAVLAAAAMALGPTTISDLMDYYAGTAKQAGAASWQRDQLESAANGTEDLAEILASEDLPEKVRSAIEDEFSKLWEYFSGSDEADASELMGRLSRFLGRKWNRIKDHVKEDADDPAMSASIERNWVQAFAVLERLKQYLGHTRITAQQARELVAAALHASQFVTVPQGADEVQIGRLGAIEIPEVHTLFLIGMNDEVLPRFEESSGGVLNNDEITGIIAGSGRQRPRTKEMQQKFDVVSAMRKAGRQLWCSYDTSGGLKPSIVIERLRGLFRGMLSEDTIDPASFRLQENACAYALYTMREDRPIPQILQEETFADRLAMAEAAREEAVEPDNVPNWAPAPASATDLEEYNECPYRYYLRKGLHARDVQNSLDTLNAGNYMHDVLQLLGIKIQKSADGPRWGDISDDAFSRFLDESLSEAAAMTKHADAYADAPADLSVVQRRIRQGAFAIRDAQKDWKFAPMEFEMDFEAADGSFSGRIDRLDIATFGDETFYFVADYKSSSKAFSQPSLWAGMDTIQLILYAMALQQLMQEGKLQKGRIAGAGFVRALGGSKIPSDKDVAVGSAGSFISVEQGAAELFGMVKNKTNLNGLHKTKVNKKDGLVNKTDAKGRGLSVNGEPNNAALELNTAIEYVREMIRNARESIRDGEVRIYPVHMGSETDEALQRESMSLNDKRPTACMYCSYGAVCRFDPTQKSTHIRCVPTSDKAALEKLLNWNAEHRGGNDGKE